VALQSAPTIRTRPWRSVGMRAIVKPLVYAVLVTLV